ncbi:MAG TPA: glycoside hydrolase family protein [Candidatus Cloacimonadota bacterium]|nr:glycoside hydrolase family protein [Candidatus Cloacimonadota bacterium]
MEPSLFQQVKDQLLRQEGLKLKPYRCPAGKLTIVVGRNLEDIGITQKETYNLLENDILRCESGLIDELPKVYSGLNDNRKSVLLNMCFNLGVTGLLGFKHTLTFIGAGDFERAANGMLASKWAKQVGRRAIGLSELMRKD